jgi:hypothetical protein
MIVKPARPRAILAPEHLRFRRDRRAEARQQGATALDAKEAVADHALQAVGDLLRLAMHQPLGIGAQRISRIGGKCARLEHAQARDRRQDAR